MKTFLRIFFTLFIFLEESSFGQTKYQTDNLGSSSYFDTSPELTYKEIDMANSEKIEFEYRVDGKKYGKGLFRMLFEVGNAYSFEIKNKEFWETIENEFIGLEKIGLVDLDGSGNEKIFWSNSSWGSGLGGYDLNLLNPLTKEKLTMELTFAYSEGEPTPRIKRSDNFSKVGLEKEIKFLEKIKYNFGINGESWVDETIVKVNPKDPEYGAYFWLEDNKKLDLGDGLIKIRSYPTNPLGGSVAKKLEAEKITYQSHFKSGVVAHNTQTDEYYIIWFPTNHYNWAFDIELVENKKTKIMYLLLNGGLISINTKTLYLKHFYTKSIDSIPPLDF